MSDDSADKFTPLVNLLHTTHCEQADLTVEQAGDILHYHANGMTCEHSRRMALVIFAWIGVPAGLPMIDATIDQVGARMRDSRGAWNPDPGGDHEDSG
jgi:hypothetical protein